jgi:hypothetical protein
MLELVRDSKEDSKYLLNKRMTSPHYDIKYHRYILLSDDMNFNTAFPEIFTLRFKIELLLDKLRIFYSDLEA